MSAWPLVIVGVLVCLASIVLAFVRGKSAGRREESYDQAAQRAKVALGELEAAREKKRQAEADTERQRAAQETVEKETDHAATKREERLAGGDAAGVLDDELERARDVLRRAREARADSGDGGPDPGGAQR